MVTRQLTATMSGLVSVALAAVLVATGGCRTESGCFSDSECGEGKICDDGKCVTGSRPGIGDLDLTGDPNQGDPYGADVDIAGDFGPQYDPQGPRIRIIFPRPYELVHNVIMISVEAYDPDDVNLDSVHAIIGDRFSVWLQANQDTGTFDAPFDTDNIGRMVLPVLTVTAEDSLGNSASVGTVFSLDNEPPHMSFDSRYRIYTVSGSQGTECTTPFSLLGENSLRNGDIIDSTYFYYLGMFPRLRIEDVGNVDTVANMKVPVFGIDNSSVFMWAADSQATNNNTRPFLVGNGPGTPCSGINPALMPDPNQPDAPDKAIVTNLDHRGNPSHWEFQPLPMGVPNFAPIPTTFGLPPACSRWGLTDNCLSTCCHLPPPLCPAASEPATYYPCYSGQQDPETLETQCHPMVYAPGEFSSESELICSGGPFDSLNFVADGIVCLTASAADLRGNYGWAQPIAICVDKDDSGDCIGFTGANTTSLCSDGCTPVDGFGVSSDPPELEPYTGLPANLYNFCL